MPDTNLSNEFTGLPLGLLVSQPILEVTKGQAALCDVYLNTLFELAFEYDKQTDEYKTRTIKFKLNRPIVNNDGTTDTVTVDVEAPILSLVPVPAFTMEEATVNFSMEVKTQNVDKDSTTEEAKSSLGYKGWGFTANISGSVTTTREHTRTTDKSAKYDIFARAAQQPPAEGMAKLTTILASVIEPIEGKG